MMGGSDSIHRKNIQDVANEMFKVKNGLARKIVNCLFDTKTENHYNQRHHTESRIPFVNSVYNGSNIILYLGPKSWVIVISEFKQIESLNAASKNQSENGYRPTPL